MKFEEKNIDERLKTLQNKDELIELEQFYVNGTFNNIEQIVENRKNNVMNLLEEYANIVTIEDKDEDGRVVDTHKKKYNPYLVSTYFFKTINPMSSIEPEYSSEKLALVWDLYMYLIEQVNINIAAFQPTITHFCKFAGITTNTLKNFKAKGDKQMQIIVNKIYDETFDSNMFLAQTKTVANKPTELRIRVENEIQDKPQVHVNVNVDTEVDLKQISSRLNEITRFREIKEDVIEVDANE